MLDYYEDWKNEMISYQGNLDKFNPEIKEGTRGSLGMDISRKAYEHDMKAIHDNIKRGAIKEYCISCKSLDTEHNEGLWVCQECGESWDPLRLRFKGI